MSTDDVDQLNADIAKLRGEIEAARANLDPEAETNSLPGESEMNKESVKLPPCEWMNKVKTHRSLKGHFGKIYALQWAADNRHLVSAAQDGKLYWWNAFTTNKIHSIALRSSWVMTCASSPSGKLLACGGLDNLCSVFKLPDGEKEPENKSKSFGELAQHEGYLSCCRFISDNEIVTSSGDSTCILWNVETMNPTAIFSDHSADVMSVSVDTNSGMFASGSCDGTVKLWDYREKRNCVQTFIGHESDVNSVQFFPDGNAIAGGSDDTSCRLFDKRSCSQLSVYSDPKLLCGITSVAFSNSGRILFAGCDDRSCLAWDTLKGSLTTMLNAHENRVSCIGTTNDGKALATGSWDFEMRIWA